MIINKAQQSIFASTEETSTLETTKAATSTSFDVVSSYQGDPFVGNLATPITTSTITRTYLSLLPAYKSGLSPLLRGINIGFVHGYLLLGPFVQLGPLRNSSAAIFIGFVSTLSLVIILTGCLVIYGIVTFPENKPDRPSLVNFLSRTGWRQFTSGFLIGGFGGTTIAYLVLKYIAPLIS